MLLWRTVLGARLVLVDIQGLGLGVPFGPIDIVQILAFLNWRPIAGLPLKLRYEFVN